MKCIAIDRIISRVSLTQMWPNCVSTFFINLQFHSKSCLPACTMGKALCWIKPFALILRVHNPNYPHVSYSSVTNEYLVGEVAQCRILFLLCKPFCKRQPFYFMHVILKSSVCVFQFFLVAYVFHCRIRICRLQLVNERHLERILFHWGNRWGKAAAR